MNMHAKMTQFAEAIKIARLIEKEVRDFLVHEFEANRRFKNGDIVSVYSGKNHKADGIVTGGRLGVSVSDWNFLEYSKEPQRLERYMKDFRYFVKAIKKDGTVSAKNAVSSSTVGEIEDDYGYWIKLKE